MQENVKEITIENGGFTTIYNEVASIEIDGVRMTPEAIGVYFVMMSLPPTWDFTINGLRSIINAGRDKILRVLSELEKYGYLVRNQTKIRGKFSRTNYTLFGKSKLVKNTPQPENPETENHTQVSTYEVSTDKRKIKGKKFPPNYHFLTIELINSKVISALDYDFEKYNSFFETLDRDYDYKNVIATTRYVRDRILKMSKTEINDIYSMFNYFSNSVLNNLKMFADKSKEKPEFLNEYLNEIKEMDN